MLSTDQTIAELLDLCRAKGLKLATAESCTGGMVGAWITDIPGSSNVFERGFITYSNSAKRELIGVSAATLDHYGAVSEEVAREMAAGALAHSEADIAVSVTGIAGPGGSEHKPEGRVCFGLASPVGIVTETVEFGALGRENVRNAAARHAISLLISSAKAF
ncbi:CinA family protein [Aliiroseovarius sp. KMU-50]|uniref:CinA family protein n=1 Tax=Aliiroseovarius salicola TaxID=3009082 RepID=A0ABT4W2N9_9RHOB|nr:CinA family protein [Aliiroseovarius sp. KMU-50]MDA5094786.1 CinA family protein [Aliiroseovarius sp. KMU-50]